MTVPRVLLLSTYYHPVVGGSETNARQLATYLRRRNIDVMVLTKRVGREAPRREVIDGINVYRVSPSGPRTSTQKWLMLPSVFWTIIRHRGEFNLVYSPDYRGIGVAGILAARLLGYPSVMSTQALGVISAANLDEWLGRLHIGATSWLAHALKWPLRTVYAMADAYPAITRAIEREARECGIPPERIHYLPNSVDLRRFTLPTPAERAQLRDEHRWPADRVVCLYLARLSREKGLMDLLSAWRELAPKNALLSVAGPDMDGHPFNVGPAARAFVEAHGLSSHVMFLGPTQTPERLLKAADVLVQPSHWEAAPFGVIEAMACGLPVVATRVGGMAEYLADGVNALLCDPRDPPGLARQLRTIIDDGELRRRLAAAGHETAVREFDQEVVCAGYADLFTSLARQRAARS